jgi:co-chaperonin GroES (HSP10)
VYVSDFTFEATVPETINGYSIGDDVEQVKVGDFVFWPQTDGLEFEFSDGEFKLIGFSSVIGIHKKG